MKEFLARNWFLFWAMGIASFIATIICIFALNIPGMIFFVLLTAVGSYGGFAGAIFYKPEDK